MPVKYLLFFFFWLSENVVLEEEIASANFLLMCIKRFYAHALMCLSVFPSPSYSCKFVSALPVG